MPRLPRISGTIEYSDAVEHAKSFFRGGNLVSPLSPKGQFEPGSDRATFIQLRGIRELRDAPIALIQSSRTKADGFDALKYALAARLALGQELPPEARDWLIDFLYGRVAEPVRRDGAEKESSKKACIYFAVKSLVESGMRPFRAGSSPKTTAIDAVADALADLSMTPKSYEGVKKIYTDLRKTERPDGSIHLDF